MRIRFFNTFEPVTDIYRHIVPAIVQRGASVSVFVSRCGYRAGRQRLEDVIGGPDVTVTRLLGPSGWAKSRMHKAIAAVGYALHASLASLFGKAVTTNVFLTQPPLFTVWGVILKKLRRQRLVLVLMDLFPDVLFASGKAKPNSVAARILTWLSRLAWRNADDIVVIGRCTRDLVIAEGIPEDKIHIIPNWADSDTIRPLPHNANPMRNELGLDDKFVVLYSGNMGEAHQFDTILQCARKLRSVDILRFVLIGWGVRRAFVEQRVDDWELTNTRLLDPQPEEKMRFSQGLGDIHFVCLKPEFTGLMVPSKTYGAFAAGRPVLYEGATDGEIARVIDEFEVGTVVPYKDLDAMTRALKEYCEQPQSAQQQGRRARELAEGQLSMQTRVDEYISVLTRDDSA